MSAPVKVVLYLIYSTGKSLCMFVFVNNNRQELPEKAIVKDALDVLNITSHRGIAIAINNNVIPRTEWETHVLLPDDKLTLIKATQGG